MVAKREFVEQRDGQQLTVPAQVLHFNEGKGRYLTQRLVIEQGSIARCQTTDAPTDLFITPGLINCHVHWLMTGEAEAFDELVHETIAHPEQVAEWAIEAMGRTLRRGITFACDKGPVGLGSAPVYRQIAEAMAQGAPITNSLFSTWTMLAPDGFGDPYGRVIHRLQDLAFALLEHEASGAQVLKYIPESAYLPDSPHYRFRAAPQVFAAARAAAREKNWIFAVHAKGVETLDQCVANRVDCVEHGIEASDDHLRAFEKHDIFWAPTMDGLRCRLEHATRSDDITADATGEWELICQLATRASQLNDGAPFGHLLFASDGGSLATPHDSLRELYLLRQAGFDSHTVFHAATINGARCLKQALRGQVEPGFRADLVVWDTDPLALPVEQWARLEQHIVGVLLHGVTVE